MATDTAQPLSNILESAKNQNNVPFFERKEVENTPFVIISEEKRHFAIMGDHRITPFYEHIEEVEALIHEKNWNMLTVIIGIIVETTIKELDKKYETTAL